MRRWLELFCFSALSVMVAPFVGAQASEPSAPSLTVDWSKVEITSRSTPTLQVVVNPELCRGTAVHDGALNALRELKADYVRYVPWLPYPRLAVAELEPPTAEKTSWDFSQIDPMTIDFLEATKGHSVILNFSTIPQWMFKTDKPVTYPADPKKVFWKYTQGTELRDPSMKELASYYARLVGWYTNGGFIDENGVRHDSGYHYSIPYWEVFNEVDFEHRMTAQQYTERYDAVVSAIHAVSPGTKFVGMALADPRGHLPFFEYFLDTRNHKSGVPLDAISYHFYSNPKAAEGADEWQTTFFTQADDFLAGVHKIEAVRLRLSPSTKTAIDEVGVILAHDNEANPDGRIPPIYWNAAGSLYAYLYAELTRLGIDTVGESQLVGYPSQYPSVSMIDWKTAKPNARFWVLKLLKDNFGQGDEIVSATLGNGDLRDSDLDVLACKTAKGRKLLIVNKRNVDRALRLPEEAVGGRIEEVDLASGENPAVSRAVGEREVTLAPFEVAVVYLRD